MGGGGALQVGNLRLVEDGSKRSGAYGSDAVLLKTASEGRCENGGKASVSMGADRTVSARGGGALQVGDLCLVEDGSKRSNALVSDAIASETASEGWDGKR